MRRVLGFLCIALLLPSAAPRAADGRVDWPTFFRLGPSQHDRVVAEVLRGTVVDVKSCDTQWCLVQYGRALGYVERATLNTNDFPPSAGSSSAACFDSVRSGYGKGQDLRFCPR